MEDAIISWPLTNEADRPLGTNGWKTKEANHIIFFCVKSKHTVLYKDDYCHLKNSQEQLGSHVP